jgi:hypothetical protein
MFFLSVKAPRSLNAPVEQGIFKLQGADSTASAASLEG